jgi:hypothetical protein
MPAPEPPGAVKHDARQANLRKDSSRARDERTPGPR